MPNKIRKQIRDMLKYLSLLPLRRKIMIISVLLIGAHFYSAPAGLWLLFSFTLYETVKQAGNTHVKRPLSKIVSESVFLIPGSILVLSAAFGAIYHGNYLNSLIAIFLLGPIVALAIMIEFMWTREDGLHFARYSVMLIIPVAIYAVLFPWQNDIAGKSHSMIRLMGTFGNPNYFSYILEIFLMSSLALMYHVWNRNTKIRLIISSVVGMICLYFTGSRTGLIAFFVGLAVFLASMSERKIMCMITVALIGIFTYASFFPDSVVELASRVFPRSVLITEGLELRFELWNIALRQINKQPFIGTGLFTYRKYIPVNASYRIAGTIHAHNIFINFWLETGLPGVISFIWILVKVLKRAFDQLKDSPFRPYLAAVIAMISITVMHGMNDAPLISSQTIIFFGIFLGISCTG